MLWTIVVLLVLLWLLGMVTAYTLGGLIHLLLLVAVVSVLIRIIQGRRIVAVILALALGGTLACGKTVRVATDDAAVSTRVRTALLNDPNVAARQIDVNATNGVVTLSGTVRSEAEAARAVALARQQSGVADVRSALQVVAQP